jgi:ABC-2 type transport system permease protein
MGGFWTTFSYLLPSTFGINGYIKINTMGANISQINMEYIGLWIQAGFYFITTLVTHRWQIIGSRRRVTLTTE